MYISLCTKLLKPELREAEIKKEAGRGDDAKHGLTTADEEAYIYIDDHFARELCDWLD